MSIVCLSFTLLAITLTQLTTLFHIAVDILRKRTVCFDGYRAKLDDELRKVKANATKTAAAARNNT